MNGVVSRARGRGGSSPTIRNSPREYSNDNRRTQPVVDAEWVVAYCTGVPVLFYPALSPGTNWGAEMLGRLGV
jgi:hypothetical protein